MSLWPALQEALGRGALRDIDLHFARTLAELAGSEGPELLLAAALVSQQTGQGHVCVELPQVAGGALFAGVESPGLPVPKLETWREALRASPLVGGPGEDTPLILDAQDRLYLGRYWHFEATIARRLRALAEGEVALADPARLRERLAHYFPASDGPDFQKLAAATALRKRLTVISGGPGTGKTTTVTRLLALLIEASAPKAPRIVLVAPTGKAAARLSESIKQARAGLDCDEAVREALTAEAATIHRLLGFIPGRSGFRHHAANPLHLDILVVDEASMVDVPLMARLLDALPEHARLILLGDKDQLASVEAGSVLGDICNRGEIPAPTPAFRTELVALGAEPPEGAAAAPSPMADSLVVLARSYRFGADSGIGHLARAANEGNAREALAICADATFADATWRDVTADDLPERIAERALSAYTDYVRESDPVAALAAFNRFRFLCALREGPMGVVEVNQAVEQALRRKGLIKPGGELHYAARPILITRNDYGLRLFNGDIGLVLPDPESQGRLRAFFTTPEGDLRRVLLSRLPPHETVYAMTIHKSQGSEFDHCTVILPDTDAPVVTRELVYTGITRAKKRVELWGDKGQLAKALARRVERASGLRDALWGEG